MATLAGFQDPAKSEAIAYFAVPLDGEKELKVEIKKPTPIDATVTDGAGVPIAGARVVAIATPRYLFLDGFDPERSTRCTRRGRSTSGITTTCRIIGSRPGG
jgi:hypothetical protein